MINEHCNNLNNLLPNAHIVTFFLCGLFWSSNHYTLFSEHSET